MVEGYIESQFRPTFIKLYHLMMRIKFSILICKPLNKFRYIVFPRKSWSWKKTLQPIKRSLITHMIQTIHKEYYLSVIQYLRENFIEEAQICGKQTPEIWLNDNAPSHKAAFVKEFLVKLTNTIVQPPHSPDMFSSNCFCSFKTQVTTLKHHFSVDKRHKAVFVASTEVDFQKFV